MQRLISLQVGETYHIYNRGAHKAPIFKSDGERERFQALLLVCNQLKPVHLGNLLIKYKGRSFIKLFEEMPREDRLVDVVAYVLMPNHFHLIVRQRTEDGISRFMRKVGTSYSMYYNARHGHSGTLFQGRFKSSHVDSDRYLLWLLRYLHLNPLDLVTPSWRQQEVGSRGRARAFLETYRWSSRQDYHGRRRPERSILTRSDMYDPGDLTVDIQDVRKNIKDGPLYL